MVEGLLKTNEHVLREHVSRFLTRRSRLREPLIAALGRLMERDLPAVIFGGAARDLMVHGSGTEPRDVDIVVDRTSVAQLTEIFADFLVRRTRFGGLTLNIRGWTVDIWPLSDTWALREFRIGSGDFEALTRTTFLNVEAVIVDLMPIRNKGRRVFASGFFEGVQNRTLDINLKENPFPELCAIRTLVTASKLRFQLTERLAKYVLRQFAKTPLEQLVHIQLNHYGCARFDTDTIYRWSKVIEAQIGTAAIIKLPVQEPIQTKLWQEPRQIAS